MRSKVRRYAVTYFTSNGLGLRVVDAQDAERAERAVIAALNAEGHVQIRVRAEAWTGASACTVHPRGR